MFTLKTGKKLAFLPLVLVSFSSQAQGDFSQEKYDSLYMHAAASSVSGEFGKATGYLEEMLTLSETDTIEYLAANFALQASEFKRAYRHNWKAIELSHGEKEKYFRNLLYTAEKANLSSDEYVEMLHKCQSYLPDDPTYYEQEAGVLETLPGDHQQELQALYVKILQLDPDYGIALFNRGIYFFNKGIAIYNQNKKEESKPDILKAKEYFLKYKEVNPSDEQIGEILSTIEQIVGA